MLVHLYLFCLITLNLSTSKCEVLPSVIWNPRNPIFDAKNCNGGNEIQAKSNDVMTIICPMKTLVSGMQADLTNNDELHENVWFTSDVTAANRCNATMAHLLMKCDKPAEYRAYTIKIRFGFTPPSFERQGLKYFLFSTGTGRVIDLENKVGGHCRTHNMILTIYYCRYAEDCKRTKMHSCGYNKEEKATTTQRPTESTIRLTSFTPSPTSEKRKTKILTVILTVPQINHRDRLISRNALSDLSEGGTGLVVFAILAIGTIFGVGLATLITICRNNPNVNMAESIEKAMGARKWLAECISASFVKFDSVNTRRLWGVPFGSSVSTN